MDEDTESLIFAGVFFGALLLLPVFIILSITTSIAWARTKKWQKEKTQNIEGEAETLIKNDEDSESELDPEDSGDEAELKAREEKRQDLTLTTRQKFRKEFCRAWKADGARLEQKKKEREDRKKLAKQVARELVKMERRKARREGRLPADTVEGLPSYKYAVEKNGSK